MIYKLSATVQAVGSRPQPRRESMGHEKRATNRRLGPLSRHRP